ncbi:MAG: ribonuclease, partial [Gaiellales bacterium]|nr:ribonuclease [Gaiellales bacterium]
VGVIARTAAAGATLEDLERDLRFLKKIWAQVEARAKASPTKTLVHQDGDLSLRVIRDLLSRNVDKVIVDTERQHRRILGWVRTTQPEFVDRIQLHTGSTPLFEQYGVETAIRSTLNRRVDLPSGGYLLFDYAEAFTVIDVNSGGSNRQNGLEDTALRTNTESAREVMRQLRLRDIGGIIVIDFIDMDREPNRKALLAVLQEELTKDRTKTYLVDISPLGLVEMTRQKVTDGVRETLTSICPTCGGEGRVLSQDTMAVEAERRLRKLARTSSSECFRIRLNAKVAAKLVGPGGAKLLELERETKKFFTLEPDMRLPLEEVDVIDEGTRAEIDGDAVPVKEGVEQVLKIAEPHMFNMSDGVARVGSYPVVVGGAINYVGEEHRVRIDRASRSIAYATLLDAKPSSIELPPEPGEFELPEFDREIGERLELEERTRGRRRRTSTTTSAKPASKAGAKADADAADTPEVVEVAGEDEGEEAKPKRRRTRGGRGRTKTAADAEALETGDAAAEDAGGEDAAAVADGEAQDDAAEPDAAGDPARPKRRRGTRGGRGRTRRTPGESANGDQPENEAVAEPAAAATAADPEPASEEKPKPVRKPRARKPKPAPEEPAPAAAEPAAPEPAAAEPVVEPEPAPARSFWPEPVEPVADPPPPPNGAADDPAEPRKKGLFGRLLGE